MQRIFHVTQDNGDGSAAPRFFQANDQVNDDQLAKLLASLCDNNQSFNMNEGGAQSFNIPDGDHDIGLTDIWAALDIEQNSPEAQAILGSADEQADILEDNLQDA